MVGTGKPGPYALARCDVCTCNRCENGRARQDASNLATSIGGATHKCCPQNECIMQGCLRPVDIRIPKDSLLWPGEEAAVVGGNVLTSQRVTDVILKCFKAAAASQVGLP